MEKFDWQVNFLYGQRSKNFNTMYKFSEIDLKNITLDKPTVFVFGGTGTNSNMQVNGYLKIIENLLGRFAPSVNIIGANYNYIEPEDIDAINRNIDMFIRDVLLKHIQKSGYVLNTQYVCKKLRNITIFAHCFGKVIAERLVLRLENILSQIGYSKNDCEKIASQIFIVSHASDPCEQKSHAKSLSVVSPLDTMLRDGDYAWRLLLKNLNNVQMSLEDKEEIKNLIEKHGEKAKQEIYKFYQNKSRVFAVKDKDEIHIAASIPLDKYWCEHALFFARRDDEYNAGDNATEVGDYVSKCLLCALCNSVANAIINNKSYNFLSFELDDLKRQLENIVKAFNNKKTISCENNNSANRKR